MRPVWLMRAAFVVCFAAAFGFLAAAFLVGLDADEFGLGPKLLLYGFFGSLGVFGLITAAFPRTAYEAQLWGPSWVRNFRGGPGSPLRQRIGGLTLVGIAAVIFILGLTGNIE